MNMLGSFSPVVIFAYNRPDHLRQTLQSLAAADGAKNTPVWVFSDGPKASTSVEKVSEVRSVLSEKCWINFFDHFEVIAIDKNKGLARSVVDGVSSILSQYDRVIVLEDDLVVSEDFLSFMNDCLTFFSNDKKVGSVAGYSPLKHVPQDYMHDVMAVPRCCSTGWATWSDRWQTIDWAVSNVKQVWNLPKFKKAFNRTGSDQLDRLRRQIRGEKDTWAIIFHYWQILNGLHTIYPVYSRVGNIGYDGSGMHSVADDILNIKIHGQRVNYKLTSPEISPVILHEFHRLYSGSWLGQLKRAILNLVPPKRVH